MREATVRANLPGRSGRLWEALQVFSLSTFSLQNVLFEAMSTQDLAEKYNIDLSTVEQSLERSRKTLYDWRNEHRPRPHLDDKIVLGWNGLMVRLHRL